MSGTRSTVVAGSRAPHTCRAADDASLVEWSLHGDEAAFDELHRRYRTLVTAVVRSDLRGSADVGDVVQEVFISAWNRLWTLRDPASIKPWLLQITRRAVIDHVRRQARRPRLDHDDRGRVDEPAGLFPGPEEIAEMRETSRRLRLGIAGLCPRDATAISLAVQFGFGPAEIGEALGITSGNAKVVLHRARTRLRAALG